MVAPIFMGEHGVAVDWHILQNADIYKLQLSRHHDY